MRVTRAVAITLAGALAGVILVLVLVLSDRDVHLAGTNNVFDRFDVATLALGDELCERNEIVPADAAAVRFSVAPGSTASDGLLRVRVLEDGHPVSSGKRRGGWGGGWLDVPITPVPRTLKAAQVCIANRGEAPLTLRGYGVEPEQNGSTLGGDLTGREIRLTYLRGEPESWWSMAGVVAHRLGLGRGELFGGWIAFAWLACVLAMGVVVVQLVLHRARA